MTFALDLTSPLLDKVDKKENSRIFIKVKGRAISKKLCSNKDSQHHPTIIRRGTQ
jgi:hypothetical protein